MEDKPRTRKGKEDKWEVGSIPGVLRMKDAVHHWVGSLEDVSIATRSCMRRYNARTVAFDEDSEKYQALTNITPKVNHPRAPVLAPLRSIKLVEPLLLALDRLLVEAEPFRLPSADSWD